ncbi:hypothetical protein NECID01_0677 [Nematocida sp. AWRm77]|nr:hypothetical protein NECID01_0677 [Nematocida sp. AWRm77]
MEYALLPEEDLPAINDFMLQYTLEGVSLPSLAKETLTPSTVSLGNSIVEVLTQHISIEEVFQTEKKREDVPREKKEVSSKVKYEIPIVLDPFPAQTSMISIENSEALGTLKSFVQKDERRYEASTEDGKVSSLLCVSADQSLYLVLTPDRKTYTVHTSKSTRKGI